MKLNNISMDPRDPANKQAEEHPPAYYPENYTKVSDNMYRDENTGKYYDDWGNERID